MRKLLIVLLLIGGGPAALPQDFYLGGDLSYVNELEGCGTVYYDETGQEADAFQLLSDKGANVVRLRLWHNPQWTNYSNLDDVKISISRAKEAGMSSMLDFHYSDFWADPSRQWRPEAWNDIESDEVLADSVYQYTYAVLNALAGEGLLPDFVQIGNETNGNILIKRNNESLDAGSPGMYPVNWPRQANLLNHGIDAVQQINTEQGTEIKTILHVAQPENGAWWFNEATTNGLTGYDIIGLSYYTQWSDMDIREVGARIAFFKEVYQKEVMIVEAGYPWTSGSNDWAGNVLNNGSRLETFGPVFSPEIQRGFLTELCYLIKENGGLGLVYWEPAWVSSSCQTYWATGSHYENATLFDFDNKIHAGADFLSYDYNQMPYGLMDKTITFGVDMLGTDTQHGVYVTGDFSGEPWSFVEMDLAGNEVYEVAILVPGRSLGAYIFYNNNVWQNQYRENVPAGCAEIDDTFREYIVLDTSEIFKYTWGECSFVNSTGESVSKTIKVYPSPAGSQVHVDVDEEIVEIRAINQLGQVFPLHYDPAGIVDVQALDGGFYFLKVKTKSSEYTLNFIKK